MEKFFIVTEQSSLNKRYFEWKENLSQIRKLADQLFTDNGIETTLFGFYGEQLCCVPTDNDLEKFDKVLGKEVGEKLRPFKGNSKIQKSWVETLEKNNLERKSKPYVPMYFSNCVGKMSSRLFDIDNVVYCSYGNEHEFDVPDGFIELKASEFFKIIEDEEDRRKAV